MLSIRRYIAHDRRGTVGDSEPAVAGACLHPHSTEEPSMLAAPIRETRQPHPQRTYLQHNLHLCPRSPGERRTSVSDAQQDVPAPTTYGGVQDPAYTAATEDMACGSPLGAQLHCSPVTGDGQETRLCRAPFL